MAYRRIICLANSRKLGKRCIAGIDIASGEWIRPVSSDSDGALTDMHYVLDNGRQPQIFDVIEVDVVQHMPKIYQPENWLIGSETWRFISSGFHPNFIPLLRNRCTKSEYIFFCRGDRVSLNDIRAQRTKISLALVTPRLMQWYVTTSYRGNRQIRACFYIANNRYDLVVTDPMWEMRLKDLQPGKEYDNRSIGITSDYRLLLTISLGEPLGDDNPCCYKLVAGVMLVDSSSWI